MPYNAARDIMEGYALALQAINSENPNGAEMMKTVLSGAKTENE